MRKVHLLFLALLFSVIQTNWSQNISTGVNYFAGTLPKALEAAKAQDKPLLIKAYTDWCGYCKLLDRKTLSDDEVATYLNTHFIILRVNMERADGPEIARNYRIKGFPTMIVLSPSGKELDRFIGYRDAATLKPELEKTIQTLKNKN